MAAVKSDGSISLSVSACHSMAVPTPMSDARKRVMMGGVRRAMSTPVSTGTSNSHGVMLNRWLMASVKEAMSCELLLWTKRPPIAKMTRARTIDGTVVTSM